MDEVTAMDLLTIDYIRATHDARHAQLAAAGSPRRPGPPWPARLRDRLLQAAARRRDHKLDRIERSWLHPSRSAAAALAAVADEVRAPAGTVLAPGAYAYIGLDDRHAGLVVTAATAPIVLTSAATLLVLRDGQLAAVAASIPVLELALRCSPCPSHVEAARQSLVTAGVE